MQSALLEPYQPIKITPLVTRITADNGSFMTGPGTNTYLIGHHEIAVIDPGPMSHNHVDAIIGSVKPPKTIKWILVTHTHPDHSPAARLLQQKTNAPLLGMSLPREIRRDYDLVPDQFLSHDERFQTSDFHLKVIHTPGHTADHLCFLLEEENTLFTGDHIMQGSTVVIIPPAGNMRDYLNSLENLKNYTIEKIAPGHGHIIDQPFAEVDAIIKHRLEREAKVISALKKIGQAGITQLLPIVYDDVPVFKHPVAALSMEAHLIKLVADGIVSRKKDIWYYQGKEEKTI